jgi:hypothetical protein
MELKRIWVHPDRERLGEAITGALTRLVPVQFKSCSEPGSVPAGEPVISLSGDERVLHTLATGRRPLFHFAATSEVASTPAAPGKTRVAFSDSDHLDRRLRGRTLEHNPLPSNPKFKLLPGDTMLASSDGVPLWIKRTCGDSAMDLVALPIPQLAAGERPFNYLNGDHFIQLLPLLHFLRGTTSAMGLERPPLRACFMFDDPNLHWKSYGFIPFLELARLAAKHRFHVAFATVPLDAWLFNRTAVQCFRDHPEQLSLLVHGNDHLHAELGVPRSSEDCLRLLAQALRRIDRLERRTGLHVARIMAPPHGACSETAFSCMHALAFQGACISPFSLRRWTNDHAWEHSFGLDLGELVADGFPIIPRLRLSDSCDPHLVIAAFLDRPLILVGHHHTLNDGLDLLVRMSETVNSLGPVRWVSPETLLTSNFAAHKHDSCLTVFPHSPVVRCDIPDGINKVIVPTMHYSGERMSILRNGHVRVLSNTGLQGRTVPVDAPLNVSPGEEIEFTAARATPVDFRNFNPALPPLWAIPRRLLCELRDRTMPVFSR